MNKILDCVIIGAGISGLMAAKTLQVHDIEVEVLDKGRGIGGRMATRWIETENAAKGFFDHGAQFFTVRDPRFQSFVDEWIASGIVKEWSRGFAQIDGETKSDGHPRYCGISGMNSIARHLAEGLKIRVKAKVEALAIKENLWQLRLENGEEIHAKALILTAPVPQSLTLIKTAEFLLPDDARAALEALTYDPCIAVMVVLDAPANLPEPGAVQINQEPISWIADNFRKGISPDVFTITIHAAPDFSRQHWETDSDTVGKLLLQAASKWLPTPVKSFQVHRWKFSQPQQVYASACLLIDSTPPLIFAGDAFGAPRIEGAAMSGISAAESFLKI